MSINIYDIFGEVEKEIYYLQKALEIYKSAYNDDHPNVAITLGNLGIALCSQNNLLDGKQYIIDALFKIKNYYEKNPVELSIQYALLLYKQSNLVIHPLNQLALLNSAQSILEIYYQGNDNIHLAMILKALGYAHGKLGNMQERKNFYKKALAMYERLYDETHYEVVTMSICLGNAYGDLGKMKKKENIYIDALKILESTYSSKLSLIKDISNVLEEMQKPDLIQHPKLKSIQLNESSFEKRAFYIEKNNINIENKSKKFKNFFIISNKAYRKNSIVKHSNSDNKIITFNMEANKNTIHSNNQEQETIQFDDIHKEKKVSIYPNVRNITYFNPSKIKPMEEIVENISEANEAASSSVGVCEESFLTCLYGST